MRLLNTTTFGLQTFDSSPPPRYAILSHRWDEYEVTYETFSPGSWLNESKSGRDDDKVWNACRIARERGLEWIWIDSCCIDKSSSEEMSRSLNSMFRWYQEAEICCTYLRDVDSAANRATKLQPFTKQGERGRWSEWFERGWTLQELLAPRNMDFFDANWERIGTRANLAANIENVTGIQAKYLDGSGAFRSASVARRLSWQSHRRTTKLEDIAYSLIGVLGVSLIPIYGEGSQAFIRLQEAFLSRYPDESLFAWTASPDGLPSHTQQWRHGEWGLLAPFVSCFQESGDVVLDPNVQLRGAGEISRTPGGIKLPILYQDLWPQRFQWFKLFFLLPPLSYFIWPCIWSIEHESQEIFTLTLNCYRNNTETGQLQNIQVNVARVATDDVLWRRCHCWQLQLRRKRPDTGPRSGGRRHINITVLQPEMLR